MRVTIVKDDNAVIVNGERHTVDCSSLPADFHALQWDGEHGEVEFMPTRCTHCGARSKKGNAILSDVTPYQPYIDAWHAAKAVADAEKAAAIVKAMADAEEAEKDAAGPQA